MCRLTRDRLLGYSPPTPKHPPRTSVNPSIRNLLKCWLLQTLSSRRKIALAFIVRDHNCPPLTPPPLPPPPQPSERTRPQETHVTSDGFIQMWLNLVCLCRNFLAFLAICIFILDSLLIKTYKSLKYSISWVMSNIWLWAHNVTCLFWSCEFKRKFDFPCSTDRWCCLQLYYYFRYF